MARALYSMHVATYHIYENCPSGLIRIRDGADALWRFSRNTSFPRFNACFGRIQPNLLNFLINPAAILFIIPFRYYYDVF